MRRFAKLIGPGSIDAAQIGNDLVDAAASIYPENLVEDFKSAWGEPIRVFATLVVNYYKEFYGLDFLMHLQEIKDQTLEAFMDNLIESMSQTADMPEAEQAAAWEAIGSKLSHEIGRWSNKIKSLEKKRNKIVNPEEPEKEDPTRGLKEFRTKLRAMQGVNPLAVSSLFDKVDSLMSRFPINWHEALETVLPEYPFLIADVERLRAQEQERDRFSEDMDTIGSEHTNIGRWMGLDQYIDSFKSLNGINMDAVNDYHNAVVSAMNEDPELEWGDAARSLLANYPELNKRVKNIHRSDDAREDSSDRHLAEEALQYLMHTHDEGYRARMLPTDTVRMTPEGPVHSKSGEIPGREVIMAYPDLAYDLARTVDKKFSQDTWDAVKGTEFAAHYAHDPEIADVPQEIKDSFSAPDKPMAKTPEEKLVQKMEEKFSAPGSEEDEEFYRGSALITKHSEYDKTGGAWELDREAGAIRRRKTMIANAMSGGPAVPHAVGETLAFTHQGSMFSGVISGITETDYKITCNGKEISVAHENVFDPGIEGMF